MFQNPAGYVLEFQGFLSLEADCSAYPVIFIWVQQVFTFTQTLFWIAKRKSRATQLSMTVLINEFRVVSGHVEQKSCHL